TVGLSHFIDYLEALEAGRIDGKAEPVITRPALAIYLSDARGGLAHTGFDRTIDGLAKAARLFGVAIFSQKNAYTCGALGYFTGRLAAQGLVSFAATNGPAVLAGSGSVKPVYCTNPMSFAAPAADGAPLVIDQSSSATAFVNIRKAAEEGKKIPEGWALDVSGNPTTDPAAAMKGAMLAFGGQRGANIALMVEVLAAGLSGANWSLDAPWFTDGP
ncbi:MAG: Ldh family oxidoreductase, partial [Mesorhizobium sp.]